MHKEHMCFRLFAFPLDGIARDLPRGEDFEMSLAWAAREPEARPHLLSDLILHTDREHDFEAVNEGPMIRRERTRQRKNPFLFMHKDVIICKTKRSAHNRLPYSEK